MSYKSDVIDLLANEIDKETKTQTPPAAEITVDTEKLNELVASLDALSEQVTSLNDKVASMEQTTQTSQTEASEQE